MDMIFRKYYSGAMHFQHRKTEKKHDLWHQYILKPLYFIQKETQHLQKLVLS